jgi:hypothetical protein
LGELEVDGAEAVEEGDEAVGVAAADGEVGAAEGFPRFGEREVELLVVDAAEELGVGGGTASGDGGEGAALAEEVAKVEGLAGNGGDRRFVHGKLQGSETGWRVRLETMRFVNNKQVTWNRSETNRPSLSGLSVQPGERERPPLIPWYGEGRRNSGVDGGGWAR